MMQTAYIYDDAPRCAPQFTGKERDAETGFDYFGARYYSSGVGRWLSPDWSESPQPVPYARVGNPQTLNLYAYVDNNPVSIVDVDGHRLNVAGQPGGKDTMFQTIQEMAEEAESEWDQESEQTAAHNDNAAQDNSDATTPPLPPTPDPAGTRTDPKLNPQPSKSSDSEKPTPLESRAHGKGEKGQTSTPDKPLKGVRPVRDADGKIVGWSIPSPDGKRTQKTLDWGKANGLDPDNFRKATKVGIWGTLGAMAIRMLMEAGGDLVY